MQTTNISSFEAKHDALLDAIKTYGCGFTTVLELMATINAIEWNSLERSAIEHALNNTVAIDVTALTLLLK